MRRLRRCAPIVLAAMPISAALVVVSPSTATAAGCSSGAWTNHGAIRAGACKSPRSPGVTSFNAPTSVPSAPPSQSSPAGGATRPNAATDAPATATAPAESSSFDCARGGSQAPCVSKQGQWYTAGFGASPPTSDWYWALPPTQRPAGPAPAVGQPPAAPVAGPQVQPVQLVDPGVLARRALESAALERADAQIAPGPDFHTYIKIANWLWVPSGQWHDVQATASSGPTSVTITASPVRVDWSLGGVTESCGDAGRAWRLGMTDAATTTCSYTFEDLDDPRGDTHEVSAEIVYNVTWTCSGACLVAGGDLGSVSAPAGETTAIEVRQRQTVVTS